MISIKSLLAATVCLLAFAGPSIGGDWSAKEIYEPELSKLEAGLKAVRAQAAGEFVVKKNPGIEVVELPLSLTHTRLPAVLAPALAGYEKALDAIRAAASEDASVASALRARGMQPDDVVAVDKAEDGSLRILVEAT